MVKYMDFSNMDVSETYLGVTFLCLAVPGCKEKKTIQYSKTLGISLLKFSRQNGGVHNLTSPSLRKE